jgi:hypothetical protein
LSNNRPTNLCLCSSRLQKWIRLWKTNRIEKTVVKCISHYHYDACDKKAASANPVRFAETHVFSVSLPPEKNALPVLRSLGNHGFLPYFKEPNGSYPFRTALSIKFIILRYKNKRLQTTIANALSSAVNWQFESTENNNRMTDKLDKSSSRLLIAAIAISLVLATGTAAIYVVFYKIPNQLGHVVADSFRSAFNFQPQVTINDIVVLEQSAPIAELAMESKRVFAQHIYQSTWAYSTKTMEMYGVFTAKAGFDLTQPIVVKIQRMPLKIFIKLPQPKLLSLQMDNYHILRDEDGYWNKLDASEREAAVTELQKNAREKVSASPLLAESKTELEKRIQEIVAKDGYTVEFEYTPTPAAPGGN